MFSAEKLLGGLVQEALSSSLGVSSRSRSRGRSRRRGSNSLERAIGVGLVGIAMAAYEHFSKGGQASPAPAGNPIPPPAPSSAPPPPPGALSAQPAGPAVLLIRAMFAAAASDGSIDDAERIRIVERMSQGGLTADERAFLDRELANPCSLFQLLEEVERADADTGVREQIYFASLIAVEVDSDREREYFQGLAEGLGLSDSQVKQLTERLS